MKCIDCIHYQKTDIIELVESSDGKIYFHIAYDCPYGDDWTEENDDVNILCKDKFEPIIETIGYEKRK